VTARVYATIAERAGLTVRGGHSAIVDAVYGRPADRQAIERVAADLSVPFVGLWLDAAESTLISRVGERRNDPSDADAGIIHLQRAQPTGRIDWHRLDASMPAEAVLQCATTCVREHVRDPQPSR
jgi:predicted kinase